MDTIRQDRARKARGKEGEELAAAYFTALGFRILARNHQARVGEVDLIAERGELLCFVEVRARASGALTSPEATVTRAKQRKVVLAAMDYVQRHAPGGRAVRFDVIAILGEKLVHLENAFDAGM